MFKFRAEGVCDSRRGLRVYSRYGFRPRVVAYGSCFSECF